MKTMTAEPLPIGASRLPAQLTHFVGRTRELADVRRLLLSARLLTLTGVGGSGKTRLAIEVAASVADQFPDGVTWIELASVSAPALVTQHIAAALGMRETPSHSATELLMHHLHDRSTLLILDNCEHVVEECAALVDVLLKSCARLTILATSREALGVGGERAWLVPPLSLPVGGQPNVRAAADAEAVQLFVDRAQSVLPSFELTNANASAVVRICRRLDGIPLAVELAAARTRVLAPEEIADRLDDSFKLLSTGQRTVLARHRTLRAAMDWSYALLAPQEQVLLQRLAVFGGGFTLEAAEAICAGGVLDSAEILDTLSALVDKSMVMVRAGAGNTRYRLLEIMRQYAQDKLDGSGETEDVRARHARFFLDLSEDAAPSLWGGGGDAPLVERLSQEADNLRAVADWCAAGPVERMEMALRLGIALQWFLFARGWFREGRARMTMALAVPLPVDALLRARAQATLAAIALWQGDTQAVPLLIDPTLPILRERDATFYAYALAMQGAAIALNGDPYAAQPVLAEAVSAGRTQPVRVLYAITHYWQAVAARARGDYDLAYQSFDVGVRIGRELNNNPSTAHPLNALGRLLVQRNQPGDATIAVTMLTEALELHRGIDDRWGMAWCFEGLAGAALALGQPERTAKLLGIASALRESISATLPPTERADLARTRTAARTALGEAAFNAAWSAGTQLPLAAATEWALGEEQTGSSEQELAIGVAVAARPGPSTADLSIHALGPLRICRGDVPLDGDVWRSSKARELLLFLLCHPEGVSREQIGVALWAEATSAQLRNNFHVTMHRLRKGLGQASWIESVNDRYRIAAQLCIDFDVDQFRTRVNAALRDLRSGNDARDSLRQAIALYRGDLLDGERVGDWHMELRDHLQRLLRDGLRALGTREFEAGCDAGAASAFERLVSVDPFNEEAHRQLLLIYARQNERGAAVRLYQKLVKLLEDELDAEPEPETTALFHKIQ
jgi:predicted ATPase/DNA-binding SARP family transcriptional activator